MSKISKFRISSRSPNFYIPHTRKREKKRTYGHFPHLINCFIFCDILYQTKISLFIIDRRFSFLYHEFNLDVYGIIASGKHIETHFWEHLFFLILSKDSPCHAYIYISGPLCHKIIDSFLNYDHDMVFMESP